MSLTTAQFNTLKAAVIADPTAAAARTAGDTYTLLQWCNGPSTTKAWRPRVPGTEVYAAHVPDEYINRSIPERGAFDLMCLVPQPHDFTQARTRTGVANIFSGTTQSSSRTTIFAAAQEFATNAQAAIGGTNASVGAITGMTETVTALVRTYTDQVTQDEANRLAV